MPKLIISRKKAKSLILWSIISAAFIGPGTVTTAAKSGATFGTTLIWALTFSIIATIVLQEAAARITLASGKSLGEIIRYQYKRRSKTICSLLFTAIFLGCSAYEAGNILGSVSGFLLLQPEGKITFIILIGLISGVILWIGNLKWISRILGIIVAGMGLAFIYSAFFTPFNFTEMAIGSIVPRIPKGSEILVIGLIGTTIVPYNLFLAAGISSSQGISEMRFGLIVAILIGGFISISILLTGMNISGNFEFDKLALALEQNLGPWGRYLFATGLAVAGLSSAITAPLATAITGQSLFGTAQWSSSGWKFRLSWITVLGLGLILGIMNIKPIPAIILAQAINGILLPLIAVFLYFAINDPDFIGVKFRNTGLLNALMIGVVGITIFLGSYQLTKVFTEVTELYLGIGTSLILCTAIAIFISGVVVYLKTKKWAQKTSSQPD